VRAGRLYATRPIGTPDAAADFVNAAIQITTRLAPGELIELLLSIEKSLGRIRSHRWGPRTVDLDLLLYDRETLSLPLADGATLVVPHPRMSFRRFVLTPAADVAGDMFDPLSRMTSHQLLTHLDTQPNAVALLGASNWIDEIRDGLDAWSAAEPQRAAKATFAWIHPAEFSAGAFPPSSHRFALLCIDSEKQWPLVRSQMKLLVYSSGATESGKLAWVGQAIDGFVGPRLALESNDMLVAISELAAALAAMLPDAVDERPVPDS
jgi:2-amino-4-hydroxy-6-hydroxymethyldihydropteridine diphosphokinase